MEENLELIGTKWLVHSNLLGIYDNKLGQYAIFKVQVTHILTNLLCIVEVKHYKTKECNKVRIFMSIESLKKEGYKI